MNIRPFLFYPAFFFLALIFFAIMLFPGSRAATAVSGKYNAIFNTSSLRMEEGRFAFPLGLKFDTAALTWLALAKTDLSDLYINLSLPTVLRRQKTISFTAQLNQGMLKGKVKNLTLDTNRFKTLEITLSQAQITNFIFQAAAHEIKAGFQAGGRIVYKDDTQTATGTAELLKLVLEMPKDSPAGHLGLTAIQFDRVDSEFDLANGVLTLVKCNGSGPAGVINLTGRIMLKGSRNVSLSGTIKPGPDLIAGMNRTPAAAQLFKNARNKGIRIRISGSLSNPNIRFN